MRDRRKETEASRQEEETKASLLSCREAAVWIESVISDEASCDVGKEWNDAPGGRERRGEKREEERKKEKETNDVMASHKVGSTVSPRTKPLRKPGTG